ncbi:hypothetical protein LOZ04_001240 [Ophidiomyces ophidiicola]|uniref:uncharacterized protein n=1 Tax=Ophidiomyces ophidiicola TaxID=1387563 RepID=UPI0020C5ADCD|nr:uncharacterized protein LOZ57_003249 [Ophidiomyces ophidiicola]KAI1936432.1 hypothetical protein LOZ62_005708 [Ophidiomyces ophidiicola]KAI1947520.1 hypothetical protein LOZ57_003249 [Ophidiomyces ophidiicola]KAI2092945.1 hypothetical protein LOZ33_005113 [Ophidiomyces ophidiicola]KAI2278982.1 hypothetical protein LOZ04_001240 [Ophidiomyces ophidiicola]KAI2317277.1 hypothetical protein LOZ00_004239 [Ophidiomyces ophidiicola]
MAVDSDEEETYPEKRLGKFEKVKLNLVAQDIAHFFRPASTATSASIPDALRQKILKKRRLSMNDTPRFSIRFNNAEICRIFDFGRTTRTRSSSIGSSGRGILQSSPDQTTIDSTEAFRDDTYYTDGSAKPIMSFRGGSSWRHLDAERDNVYLDLFWSSHKENPFRPEIMPIVELAPLSNFRHLRILKLTGMLQSYQPYIWQAVWLNQNLEELHLEMALEPCIRQTFCASWPKIRGNWFPRTAVAVRGLYYGKSGRGELQRRVGFGEYLDKHAIAAAKIAAAALGPTSEKLPVVKLTLMGFVVDSDPFFLWFNPHRLRSIDFKDHCVDAGFALPVKMSEHVIVSWPREDSIGEAKGAKKVWPGEIRLIHLGSKKEHVKTSSSSKGRNKGKTKARTWGWTSKSR